MALKNEHSLNHHTGSGHKWRLLDEQPWRRVYVVVPDAGAILFKADEEGACHD